MVEVPIFIVNGLIESGKTTLIKEIIENNVSYQAAVSYTHLTLPTKRLV